MADQNPSPVGENQIRDYYNSVYYKDARPNIRISGHFSRLASKIGMHKGNAVLDVACGQGNWLLAVDRMGANPSGIDISDKAIDICRTILPHAEFHVGSADRLPFEDKRFDVVSCLGALEHFPDPVGALKEMVRTARDDAKFLLLVPNAGFLTRRLGLYKGTDQIEIHEEWRTLEEWNGLFESAGLAVLKRWKDLHVLSRSWIDAKGLYHIPLRMAQAISLVFWPLSWQYQVYHLCRKRR
ncbi:MAG: class I SAM-dependent methyltransferase [Desulfobacterales bacterium]|jgi:SAM-dependent methyltransferase